MNDTLYAIHLPSGENVDDMAALTDCALPNGPAVRSAIESVHRPLHDVSTWPFVRDCPDSTTCGVGGPFLQAVVGAVPSARCLVEGRLRDRTGMPRVVPPNRKLTIKRQLANRAPSRL